MGEGSTEQADTPAHRLPTTHCSGGAEAQRASPSLPSDLNTPSPPGDLPCYSNFNYNSLPPYCNPDTLYPPSLLKCSSLSFITINMYIFYLFILLIVCLPAVESKLHEATDFGLFVKLSLE